MLCASRAPGLATLAVAAVWRYLAARAAHWGLPHVPSRATRTDEVMSGIIFSIVLAAAGFLTPRLG